MHAVPLDRSWIKEFMKIWITQIGSLENKLWILQASSKFQKLIAILKKKLKRTESKPIWASDSGPNFCMASALIIVLQVY
jgi:hypothetical protein